MVLNQIAIVYIVGNSTRKTIFMSCEFTKNWFNAQNESSFLPAMQLVVLGNFVKSANQV